MTATVNHATTASTAADPIAETLDTIDVLLTHVQVLSEEIAATRAKLADLAEERALREAMAALSVDGKNETERHTHLRLHLSASLARHLSNMEPCSQEGNVP